MKNIIVLLTFLLCCGGCFAQRNFVKVAKGHFFINSTPYYYTGTNFWYGAILGSTGKGGNRVRLIKELDHLHALGLNNLRVLVGADGKPSPSKVSPTLQVSPGVYNDTILAGLDYLLKEMDKRGMKAILYLNNSWEWTGGYSQYLAWAGAGKAPIPAIDGWPKYMEYVRAYATNDSAQALFRNHVHFIVTRTNRYTHLKYVDDPTIMSWQIGNEPRAFSDEGKAPFRKWMRQVSALIKSLDRNHLVTSGSEGKHGCEEDMNLFEQVHADPNIDYLCAHIWPYNWQWIGKTTVEKNVKIAEENTAKYIDEHLAVAKKLNKPLVIEEYGYPRDGFDFSKTSTTTARDEYYRYVYTLLIKSKRGNGNYAGCNFWGWGGDAQPIHKFWQEGDDYCGDPAQEEQGLNSVFSSDKTTLNVIKSFSKQLKVK